MGYQNATSYSSVTGTSGLSRFPQAPSPHALSSNTIVSSKFVKESRPDDFVMDDEALTAAEEGRYSRQPPKVYLCGSPKLCWRAFQAMRQVGESESRVLSEAEVQQLCSPRLF